jgi:hypothetical protein
MLEFKTASMLGDMIFGGFRLNPQILGYAFFLRQWSKQLGEHYNLEQLDEAFVDFLEVRAPLKTKLTQWKNQLIPVPIHSWHLQDFLEWARFWGTMWLEMERTKSFPKDFAGCHPYPQFGSIGFVCGFQNLCLVEDWRTLKEMYGKRNYNPYKLIDVTVKGQPAST